ncbi:MAG: 5-formyltetrahydrofolate cyclo-ligase [Verrucomicrobiota bacterium]|nr:5-formyltetrahydrofolate cyclo-ligase [Limisphaera sp.]MDW8380838.1 5-formyltetrahydrofolate cyclo-ligase [Verrucomicrobiota bacterium]
MGYPGESVFEQKHRLRIELRSRLASFPPEQRRAESQAICSWIVANDAWQRSRTVLLFAPLQTEPDVSPLWELALRRGKILTLPRYDATRDCYVPAVVPDPNRDLRPGLYGVREPRPELPLVPWEALDLLVLPGLAFDLQGRRLGRGGGHYDRILQLARGLRCGVAFTCQLLEQVPTEPGDMPVQVLVTLNGWMELGSNRSRHFQTNPPPRTT